MIILPHPCDILFGLNSTLQPLIVTIIKGHSLWAQQPSVHLGQLHRPGAESFLEAGVTILIPF